MAWVAGLYADVRKPDPSASDTYAPAFAPFGEVNRFRDPDWFNWGGSILRGDDGTYYLFYSRWPRHTGFLSWLTHSEIAVATSDHPAGPWTYHCTVLRGRGPGHWDAVMAHNPKIKKFGDRYYLYYISTTSDLEGDALLATARGGYQHPNWAALRNAQRIGVATAASPLGPWTRRDRPLLEPSPPLHTLAVNPAITRRPDGGYLMMVKGDRSPRPGSKRIQAVAVADQPDGPFTVRPEPAIRDIDTEDASLWYDRERERYYAVFHAHTHYGLITSTDGTHWQQARHAPFAPKGFMAEDGTLFRAGRMERPNVHLNDRGVPEVFITSYRQGDDTAILTIPLQSPTP